MKLFFKLLFITTLLYTAQTSFAERIKNYDVNITLNKDASMRVVETIDYDFENQNKHGIFRFIPINFSVEGQPVWYGLGNRRLSFENLSVNRDGQSEPYTLEEKDENGNYFIKIGSANSTITGLHRYQIIYTVHGSLRYFDEYDELYWNATGLDWNIPIDAVSVRVQGNSILFGDYACYSGGVGSTNKCDRAIKENDATVIFSQNHLSEKQGLTVAISFSKGMVPVVENKNINLGGIIAIAVGGLISLLVSLRLLIRRYQRKYFTHDLIHARYTPPENLHPTLVGTLVDKKLHPRDISAGIIQLAIDGYITIEKISKNTFFGNSNDYIFTLKKEKNTPGTQHINKILIDIIFGDIYALKKLGGGRTKKMSEISSHFVSVYVSKLNIHASNILNGEGYIEKSKNALNVLMFILFVLAFIFFILRMIIPGMVSFFLIFFAAMMLGSYNQRYTKKGWETKHSIEGFKLFLEMTEKERYEMLNNPANNSQEFMQYLPYAIALGVEKKWAQQFNSITISNPDWYTGAEPFAAVGFVNEISSFTENINSSVAKSTRSSNSSSRSGSRGGGSSGGGSGGGGGGSW